MGVGSRERAKNEPCCIAILRASNFKDRGNVLTFPWSHLENRALMVIRGLGVDSLLS